jgi:hypothetical protein
MQSEESLLESTQQSPLQPEIITHEDSVEIRYGNEVGWVSSFHLVDTKINQLKAAHVISQASTLR